MSAKPNQFKPEAAVGKIQEFYSTHFRVPTWEESSKAIGLPETDLSNQLYAACKRHPE